MNMYNEGEQKKKKKNTLFFPEPAALFPRCAGPRAVFYGGSLCVCARRTPQEHGTR